MAQATTYPLAAMFKGLKTLLTSLPSENEKKELLHTIGETTKFLGELQTLVQAFPTVEASQGIEDGLARLDLLAMRANNDAAFRKLLGLKPPARNGVRAKGDAGGVTERANKLVEALNSCESPRLGDVISGSGETISVLIQVAKSLGLRTTTKERKPDLERRIANHIENQRGYKILSGGDIEPPARTVTQGN